MMSYQEQIEMAKEMAKTKGDRQPRPKHYVTENKDADLWECMTIRKTHISHLKCDYAVRNYFKDVRD